jgi:hypothetical protein
MPKMPRLPESHSKVLLDYETLQTVIVHSENRTKTITFIIQV